MISSFVKKEELTIYTYHWNKSDSLQIVFEPWVFLVSLTNQEYIYCMMVQMLHYFKLVSVPLWSSKEFSRYKRQMHKLYFLSNFFPSFPHREGGEREQKYISPIGFSNNSPQFCEHRRRDSSRGAEVETMCNISLDRCLFNCCAHTQTTVIVSNPCSEVPQHFVAEILYRREPFSAMCYLPLKDRWKLVACGWSSTAKILLDGVYT